MISEKELIKRLYKRWLFSVEEAEIPVKSRKVMSKTFFNTLHGTKAEEVTKFIYDMCQQDEWNKDFIFIIEGTRRIGEHQPDSVRRRLGHAILLQGVSHAVLRNENIPYPYGYYIDCHKLKDLFLDKNITESVVTKLAEYHYLHISEIPNLKELADSARAVFFSRMDDLIRRRRDTARPTILSFEDSCSFLRRNVDMGRELGELLALSSKYGTVIDRKSCIVKVATSELTEGS